MPEPFWETERDLTDAQQERINVNEDFQSQNPDGAAESIQSASAKYFTWTPATALLIGLNGAVLLGDPVWWLIHHGRQYIAGSAGDGAPAQAEPEAASEGD